MADVSVKELGDFEVMSPPDESPMAGMAFHRVRAGIEVGSFGISVIELPAGFEGYPDHDHSGDGQEETYTALSGSGTLHAGGAGGEGHALEPGVFARVGAGTRRKVVTGEVPMTLLILGAPRDSAYDPEGGMSGISMAGPGDPPQEDGIDVTVCSVDDCERVFRGGMARLRAELGGRSLGMQVLDLPPGFERYPEHDHVESGQEEVYVSLGGSATLRVGGDGGEEHTLTPGTFARVGPAEQRKIVTGDQPARLLALGGTPGEAFVPAARTEKGAPDPLTQQG